VGGGSEGGAELGGGAAGSGPSGGGRLAPGVPRIYAGCVVWRGAPAEARLSAETRAAIFPYFTFFLPPRQQVLGYPIAGLDNELAPGLRRYNFIWYRVVDAGQLRDLCTDAEGHHHDFSIAPPLIRDDVIAAMRRDARTVM